MNNQHKTPLLDALVDYSTSGVTLFDVPGHKMGRGMSHTFTKAFGQQALQMDINSTPGLDILNNPQTVIREAEELAAEFFGADHAFFLVNGSTSGIQSMILAAVKPGEKLILPRNIHKSAVDGLILSGANPVYIYPEVDPELGISVGHSMERTIETIHQHPDAKAIFLLHPTYYGFTTDIKPIIDVAHSYNMMVIVDESHGSHFYLDSRFGKPAISLGADMATISMHKTGGSLTQSSMLLMRQDRISRNKVLSAVNIVRTSSASYLLMSSLDAARHHLAMHPELGETLHELSTYATDRIKEIPGISLAPTELLVNNHHFFHDVSKLLIDVSELGVTGQQVFQTLRDKYNIQLELGESNIILAIFSIADTKDTVDILIRALEDISLSRQDKPYRDIDSRTYFKPEIHMTPREAFFCDTEYIPLDHSAGKIAGDQVMIYPPGVPILIPGEKITEAIITEYKRLIKQGNKVVGTIANGTIKIKVIMEEQS